MNTPLLETRGLSRNFGVLTATNNVSFRLDTGARHALIGPNGAGKTTFINLLAGTLPPSKGQVLLDGTDITKVSEPQRVKLGIARTFQINRLFRGLTVLENVFIAVAERAGVATTVTRPTGACNEVVAEAMSLLGMLNLTDQAGDLVRELPYGRQRLVEIAIALALKPKVLLLDEPAAGVPSSESHIILDVIGSLDPSIAVLIIEHDMDVVFRFAKRITVMVQGAILTEGSPEDILADARVRAVYLGEEAGARHG